MVKVLTDAQTGILERAIREAEGTTSAEIIVCIKRASGDDRGIAAVAGALAMIIAFVGLEIFAASLNEPARLGASLALAVITFVACDRFDIGLKLLPRRLVARHARRAAREVFLDRDADSTPLRNAVLLFISRAERYVEILPDRGLADVPQQRWADIVASFKESARQKGMVDAAADAIAQIGAVCAGPFPAGADNPDLISNKPITD